MNLRFPNLPAEKTACERKPQGNVIESNRQSHCAHKAQPHIAIAKDAEVNKLVDEHDKE